MAKIIEHSNRNYAVCIYSVKDNVVKGSFFKEKPELGDFITSDSYNGLPGKVVSVMINRDAKIASDCTRNPKLAYFELKIRPVLLEEIKEILDN